MGSNPLPPAPCTTTFRWQYFRQLTVADHIKNVRRPLLRAKTSVGSISAHDIASGSPAPRKAPRTLALLLDRLSGYPSFSPAPTIGASLFDPPHPSSDHYFPGAVIAPQPALETVDCPSDYGFSRQYLSLHFQDHQPPPHCSANTSTRAPSSPELCRYFRFATRAPRSPEFHLSPELRRHPSFKARDPPFSELHFRQSSVVTCRHLSFATRAPPSSELHL